MTFFKSKFLRKHGMTILVVTNSTTVKYLGIRICRIRMFLGLPDPDPLRRGTDLDPDPSLFS